MPFRDVSFSDCSHSRDHISETDTYTTTFFAYDVIQGLFQYVIQFTLPFEPSTLPPSFQVTLLGVYPLVSALGRIASSIMMPTASPQERSYLMRLSARQSRGPNGNINRGFVSTHAMGSQGMRGVWIERKRSSPLREVHVWSKEPDLDPSVPAEIEQRVVYSVSSGDLLEEIKYCTLSELTGKIVLGSRSGDITILNI